MEELSRNVEAPAFIDSEWFVPEPDNWHLKDGAPEELVKEFNEYMGKERDGEVDQ